MRYKVLLLALAITTSCSPQANINYQIVQEQPLQVHGTFQCFGCLEHAHHRQMAPGEAKPGGRLVIQYRK